MHHNNKLAWIGIALGVVALLIALGGHMAAARRSFYDPRGAGNPPVVVVPNSGAGMQGAVPPRAQWDGAPRWHDGAGPGRFHRPCGPTPGSILLGGLLIGLGVWLYRRGRHNDGSQDPPPNTGQSQVV